jgi:hypothetical protein
MFGACALYVDNKQQKLEASVTSEACSAIISVGQLL